jgi:hypothetical protein
VIIYGLQENGCDWDDVTDIFSLTSCCAKPHKMHRFGRADRYGARPLKIEFYSPSDSREVLACARQLRDNDATYHLRLRPWLNQQQMSKIKDLRSKCTELNNTAAASGDNSRPYVVISGELKVRTKGGKLVPYKRLSVGKPSQQMPSKPPSDSSFAVKPPPPSDASSHPKKRVGREPEGSHATFDGTSHLQAALHASRLNIEELLNRHQSLEQHLKTLKLTTVDVRGDGNCFYRAVCHILHGNDDFFMLNCARSWLTTL